MSLALVWKNECSPVILTTLAEVFGRNESSNVVLSIKTCGEPLSSLTRRNYAEFFLSRRMWDSLFWPLYHKFIACIILS